MLYIVSTPIGNLADITLRALQVLKECDYVLCEDTRRSLILLDHYQIKKKLVSFHKFNEKKEEERVLQDLQEGKNLALISDAGTPTINDPGLGLVRRVIELKLPFTAIPGPTSLIQGLVLSGFDSSRFQFVGFLDDAKIRQIQFYQGTSIAFVAPHDLLQVLEKMGKRRVAVARELTKTFEECLRGNADEILQHYQANPPKGEIVLLVEAGELNLEIPLDELLELLQEEHGLSLKEAIKMAAKILKQPKSQIYKSAHQ